MEKGLFKLHFDCGRMGKLNGLFIADIKAMSELVESGREVYFGEVLGKHSEVYGPIEECDYSFITDDENVIKVIEEHDLENGYNPFHYLNDEDYDEEE